MDNKILQNKFRHQLTSVHALTVLTVSLIEIIGYVVLVNSGVETFSISNPYLWYGVVLPIAVNAITHIIARAFVHNPNGSDQRKNRSIITAALVTSFVVAIIHKEYIVTSCAFIFPIILSAMFNDRKLLNTSFLSSILILICVAISFGIENSITLTTVLNLIILFGFAFVSYLCAGISINFSSQSYTTIEAQAKENDRLMDDVMRDPMTDLYNHGSFTADLDKALSNYTEESPIVLVMIDIDDFKSINDTYGHDSGDEVLIKLADTLRKYDTGKITPYRYGGEEFALISVGHSKNEIFGIMQNILSEFVSLKYSFADKAITLSAGVAEYSSGMSCEVFFDKADDTLYLAKHQGKNRILAAE